MSDNGSLQEGIKELNGILRNLRELSDVGPKAVRELSLKLIESLEGEAQAAIENAYRILELSILNTIAQELSSAVVLDINDILELVHEQVSLLMESKNLYVAFYDDTDETVSFPFVMDQGRRRKETGEWKQRKAGRGLTEYVVRKRSALLLKTIKEKDDFYASHRSEVEQIGALAKSWLGVPMIARNKVIGVIAVQDYNHEHVFGPNDQTILSTIAGQAAIAVANAQLFQSRNRQLNELQQLREVGQIITSTIDEPHDVLRKVVQGAKTVMNADVVALYPMIDGKFGTPIIEGARRNHDHDPLPREDGIAAKILAGGLTVYKDLNENPEIGSRFIRSERIRSFAGIPLRVGGAVEAGTIVGGDAVGVLYFDYRKPHRFTDDERNTIHLFAAQAAVAIHNARLFETANRRLDEIQQLAQVGHRILTKPDDPRRVLQDIANQAVHVLKADLVILYVYHQSSQKFDLPTIRAGVFVVPEFPEHSVVDENDIAFKIVAGGVPYYTSDSASHPVLQGVDSTRRPSSAQPFVVREKIMSSAGVPLKAADETVGVLFVNYRTAQAFDEHQRAMIEIFANSAAIAIQNARLFEQVRKDLDRRVEEFDTLADVDKAITTESLDTMLERMLAAALKIIGAPNGNVMLVDDSGEYLDVRAILGQPWPEGVDKRFKIGEHGISGWVAKYQRSELIPDVDARKWESVYIEVLPDTRSELATPMLDENQRLRGVINLESPNVAAFTEDDQRLLEALARRAVIAVQNQRRYQREQQLRRELWSLSEVDKAISSTLELEKVLEMILEKGLELMDVPMGNIMLFDKVKGDLRMAVQKGVAKEHLGTRQVLGEGIVGRAAAEMRCLLVSDVTDPEWRDVYQPFIPGMRSELAVPIIAGDSELVGIINAESPIPGDFSESDLRLLKNLADNAVIAIRNAEQFRRLEALRDIDRVIIASQDSREALQVILDYALDLTGAEIGELRTIDGYSGELVVQVSRTPKGVAVNEAWKRIPAGKGITGWCVAHGKPMVVSDTSQDTRYIPYFQGMRSEVAVPLMQGDKAVGVLSLESPRPGAFDQRDVDWLEALAGQAVVAIQNIERLEQAQSNSDRLADLHQAGKELGGIGDIFQLQQAYDIVLRIAAAHTHSHQAVIRRYDPRSQELALVRSTHPTMAPPFERMSTTEGASGQAFRERGTVLVPDVTNPPPNVVVKPSYANAESILLTAICFEEHCYGTLGLSHTEVGHFGEADVMLVEGLAKQLAITIHRLEAAEARQIAEQRAVAAETMGAMGHSAFELAHRLGNDLGTVRTYVEGIQKELSLRGVQSARADKELKRILRDVQQVLDLSSGLKEAFRDFKEGGSQMIVDLPVRVLFEEAVASVHGWPETVEVRYGIADDTASVRADHRQVADILYNLLTNAIEAMPKGGTVTLRASDANQFVELQVADTGKGIKSEDLPRIFNLFYSTKGSFGFGLWSARRHALANGGDLTVESKPSHGATFTLTLPQSDRLPEIEHGK